MGNEIMESEAYLYDTEIFNCFVQYVFEKSEKTLQELAEEHKIGISRIKYFSKKDSWVEIKEKKREKVRKEIVEAIVENEIEKEKSAIKIFYKKQVRETEKLSNIVEILMNKVEAQLESVDFEKCSPNAVVSIINKLSLIIDHIQSCEARRLGIGRMMELLELDKHME